MSSPKVSHDLAGSIRWWNNAGVYIGKPFTQHTPEDYAALVNVNMAGFYHVTRLAITEMERHSSGHVVSVTSKVVVQFVWVGLLRSRFD